MYSGRAGPGAAPPGACPAATCEPRPDTGTGGDPAPLRCLIRRRRAGEKRRAERGAGRALPLPQARPLTAAAASGRARRCRKSPPGQTPTRPALPCPARCRPPSCGHRRLPAPPARPLTHPPHQLPSRCLPGSSLPSSLPPPCPIAAHRDPEPPPRVRSSARRSRLRHCRRRRRRRPTDRRGAGRGAPARSPAPSWPRLLPPPALAHARRATPPR